MQLIIPLAMSSPYIVLALCVTLTTSLTLNQGRHDLLGGVGEGVGSAYSAPLNMEIAASVDINPFTPSEPSSFWVDKTTSMVKPDVEIAFNFVPRENLIATTDIGASDTGGTPREGGGSTISATTDIQTSVNADSDALFPVINFNDGADIIGNILPVDSADTRQISLGAPNDVNLPLLPIAAEVCKVQSSSKRRVKRGGENSLDQCVTKISPPASEIKPEQSNPGVRTGASEPSSEPPEKKKKNGPPFDPATVPDFRGLHFREDKSTCPHEYTTIPVCALRVDERDWATSTSVSFYSTLLESVTCMCSHLWYL